MGMLQVPVFSIYSECRRGRGRIVQVERSKNKTGGRVAACFWSLSGARRVGAAPAIAGHQHVGELRMTTAAPAFGLFT